MTTLTFCFLFLPLFWLQARHAGRKKKEKKKVREQLVCLGFCLFYFFTASFLSTSDPWQCFVTSSGSHQCSLFGAPWAGRNLQARALKALNCLKGMHLVSALPLFSHVGEHWGELFKPAELYCKTKNQNTTKPSTFGDDYKEDWALLFLLRILLHSLLALF